MANIGALNAKMGIDIGNFAKGLSTSIGKSRSWAKEIQRVTESVMTPLERYRREMSKLNIMRAAGMDATTHARAVAKLRSEYQSLIPVLARVPAKYDSIIAKIDTVSAKMRRAGQTMTQVGRNMSMYITAPIVAAGIGIFRAGSAFEAEMSKIVGLVGISRQQVNAWKSDLLRMGPELGKTPTELAQGLYFITSAGIRGQRALDALVISAKASSAGLGETAIIADAITSAMNAFSKQGMTAARAADILTAAVREGKLEAASINPVIGDLLPMASAMGVAFSDVAGALAAMSRTGQKAEEAAVSIRAIFMTLLKPTDEAVKMLKSAGLSFSQLRDLARQSGGIVTIMRLLEERFRGNDEALAKIIPNIRAIRGAMNLLAQNAEVVDGVMRGVRDSTGSLDNAFKEASGTGAFKMNQAMSQFISLAIKLSDTLIPLANDVMAKLLKWTIKLSEWWGGLSKSTQKFLTTALALTAALGPLLIFFGTLTTSIGALVGGIGKMAFLLVAIVPKLYTFGAALLASQAGILAMKGGLMALSYWLGYKLGESLGKAIWGVTEFERQMEISSRSFDEFMRDRSGKEAITIAKLGVISNPAEQKSAIENEIVRATKRVEGLQWRLKHAQRAAKKLNTSWNSIVGNKNLELANKELEKNQRLADAAADYLRQLQIMLIGVPKAIAPGQMANLFGEASDGAAKFEELLKRINKEIAGVGKNKYQSLREEAAALAKDASANYAELAKMPLGEIAKKWSESTLFIPKIIDEAISRLERVDKLNADIDRAKEIERSLQSPADRLRTEALNVGRLIKENLLDPALGARHLAGMAAGTIDRGEGLAPALMAGSAEAYDFINRESRQDVQKQINANLIELLTEAGVSNRHLKKIKAALEGLDQFSIPNS